MPKFLAANIGLYNQKEVECLFQYKPHQKQALIERLSKLTGEYAYNGQGGEPGAPECFCIIRKDGKEMQSADIQNIEAKMRHLQTDRLPIKKRRRDNRAATFFEVKQSEQQKPRKSERIANMPPVKYNY